MKKYLKFSGILSLLFFVPQITHACHLEFHPNNLIKNLIIGSIFAIIIVIVLHFFSYKKFANKKKYYLIMIPVYVILIIIILFLFFAIPFFPVQTIECAPAGRY
jgi:hypothetical protein